MAHRMPHDCPVCGHDLDVTRLGCASCGTELAGTFSNCEFCALSGDDLDLIKVFLASRGNVRELEKHLGVSYPTARQRLGEVLGRLGLADPPTAGDAPRDRDQILADVAAGRLSAADAQDALQRLGV